MLPLAIAACYLLSSNKYVGPNNIMEETIEYFVRCFPLSSCASRHTNAATSSGSAGLYTAHQSCGINASWDTIDHNIVVCKLGHKAEQR